jgi:endonuclease/exonuclease/phosphatase family metal-dependent hydrolase
MPRPTRRGRIGRALLALLGTAPLWLWALNGTWLAHGTHPRQGQVVAASARPAAVATNHVTVMAFNIAKCFVYEARGRLADRAAVEARLAGVAGLVREQNPDLLFLSEAVWEGGWGGVNQVAELARATGLTNYVFGENFCFGWPGHRLVCGNAILSRGRPVRALANPDLPGRRPFWVTRNNRRALRAEWGMESGVLELVSLHNDSFVPTNNVAQVRFLLERAGGGPAVWAGDFNATPDSESMHLLRRSGRFSAEWAGPPTLPNVNPDRTIDYVLGPAAWTVVQHRVLTNSWSDHCAVVTTFRRT